MIDLSTPDFQRGEFTISTDKAKLDIPFIHDFLSQRAYWALGRSLSKVVKSIENSVCFGVYHGSRQVGFARVVTDYATFAWMADVFVLEDYRGKGLGRWLVETISAYPTFKDLRLFLLATRDAQELYHRFGGFEHLEEPQRWMARWNR